MSDCVHLSKQLFESYKRWVSANPQFLSDIETTAKWVSYFVAGRISNSSILSELVYSLSNILVLFNDRIIEKSNALAVDESSGHRLKMMLTTLEYCEVFIEISAKRLWGERGRWFLVIVVQVLKSLGRYLLMQKHCEEIIKVPLIPVLDRSKVQEKSRNIVQNDITAGEGTSYSFKLKRSGRIVRKIEGAPPVHLRNWKPLQAELNTANKNAQVLQTAENLYIAKPLIHLASIGIFGYNSWKSYSTSLLVDLVSIRMYHNHRDLLTKQQKVELSRRCVNLLMYLVRSPFYDRYSEKRIVGLLNAISNTIPFTRGICEPVAQYVPIWQNTYFYMWSS